MNSISKVYKTKFKERLITEGFSLYRNTFYRANSDVIQTIMLTNHDTDYTVHFYARPLYLGIWDLSIEGFQIHDFREKNIFDSSNYWRNFNIFTGLKLSDEEINSSVDEMLSIVVSHVLPIFARGADWKSSYDEMEKLRKKKYGKTPYSPRHDTYCMHIKAGEYEKAIVIAQHFITQNESWKERYTPELEHLLAGNTAYFENLFAAKEAQAREYLTNPRKHKPKQGY